MALRIEETGALELFMNALKQPALLSDKALTCIDCNEAMCRSLGLSREQVIGRRLDEVMDPATSESRRRYALEVVETGEERSFEARSLRQSAWVPSSSWSLSTPAALRALAIA